MSVRYLSTKVDFFTPNEKFGNSVLFSYPGNIISETQQANRKPGKKYYKLDCSLDEAFVALYNLNYHDLKLVLKNVRGSPYEIRDSKTGEVLEVIR